MSKGIEDCAAVVLQLEGGVSGLGIPVRDPGGGAGGGYLILTPPRPLWLESLWLVYLAGSETWGRGMLRCRIGPAR